jgi:HTH-type transcriptional regulator / antitoxin HipB
MDFPLALSEQLRPQLKALRKQRGLTQAQLGALLGVSQARVVEIEANPGAVSLQQILQVLQLLGAGLVVRAGTHSYSAEPPATQLRVEEKRGEW